MHFNISVVITLHAEGRLLHRTLKALHSAVSFAQHRGLSVEIVAVLDRVTDNIVRETLHKWCSVFNGILFAHEVDYGALSLSRNYGVSNSNSDFISILDGDDLYCEHWLSSAFDVCSAEPCLIAHPEAYFRFPIEPFLRYCNNNKMAFLDLMNCNQWPALSMAHRDIFKKIPYVKDDRFYAYQDWLWNCETAANGYRHVLVPRTLMAIRQKRQGKSLWQNSHSLNKVVRPNKLFRQLFLMEYNDCLEAIEKVQCSRRLIDFMCRYCARLRDKLWDYLLNHHRLLLQLLVTYKRSLVSKIISIKKCGANPVWVKENLLKLSRIDPTINNFSKFQVRRTGLNFKILRTINSSMSALIKAEKPKIYALGNLTDDLVTRNALYYIHAMTPPVFVITTENGGNQWRIFLPLNCIHIDIGNTDLNYEEKMKLIHRLLLESNPEFIHVFDSMLALEMFDRYPGTFMDNKIFASFFEHPVTKQNGKIGWALSHYPQLLDFFSCVSTDTSKFREQLLDIFGVEKLQIISLRPPVAPWVFKNITKSRYSTKVSMENVQDTNGLQPKEMQKKIFEAKHPSWEGFRKGVLNFYRH